MGAALQAAGVFLGITAVGLQFEIMTTLLMEVGGLDYAGAVVGFFSYFTILTNMLAVTVHLAGLLGENGALAFFQRPLVRGAAVVSILVVSVIYHLLLANLWNPQGLHYYTDLLLHYVCPALMVVWWLGFGRTGLLRWSDVPAFLIFPLAYLVYVLVRARIVGIVPYPFLDYWTHGWWMVAQTALGIAVLFAVIGALIVAIDRFLRPVAHERNPL